MVLPRSLLSISGHEDGRYGVPSEAGGEGDKMDPDTPGVVVGFILVVLTTANFLSPTESKEKNGGPGNRRNQEPTASRGQHKKTKLLVEQKITWLRQFSSQH